MGYMKSLDLDAQEALEMVANLVGAEQVPDHGELLEGLQKLGWIPPTVARAAHVKIGIALVDPSFDNGGWAVSAQDAARLRALLSQAGSLLEPGA